VLEIGGLEELGQLQDAAARQVLIPANEHANVNPRNDHISCFDCALLASAKMNCIDVRLRYAANIYCLTLSLEKHIVPKATNALT
jgi:hypothetical protein